MLLKLGRVQKGVFFHTDLRQSYYFETMKIARFKIISSERRIESHNECDDNSAQHNF